MKNRIEPTGQSAEPWAVTNARKVLAASMSATPGGDVDLARWWGRVEGALELLLAHIDADQGDEEPLAGDQGDGEECGVPDLAPLIVAAPTEPPTAYTTQDDEDQDDADGGCAAQFIDGSWTYDECGCGECRTRLAEDEEADL